MPSFPNRSRIPKLKSSWCGCSLETAAKIVGYIMVIVYSAMLILWCMVSGLIAHEIHISSDVILHEDVPLLVYMVISYFFKGLISIYLLVGVYKKRPSYVKLWVTVQGALLIMSVVAIVIYLILLMVGYSDHPMLVIELLTIGINAYFVLLVYSYYRELGEGSDAETL